jgi:hypothetical protein
MMGIVGQKAKRERRAAVVRLVERAPRIQKVDYDAEIRAGLQRALHMASFAAGQRSGREREWYAGIATEIRVLGRALKGSRRGRHGFAAELKRARDADEGRVFPATRARFRDDLKLLVRTELAEGTENGTLGAVIAQAIAWTLRPGAVESVVIDTRAGKRRTRGLPAQAAAVTSALSKLEERSVESVLRAAFRALRISREDREWFFDAERKRKARAAGQ